MVTRVTNYQLEPANLEELRRYWSANMPKIWKAQAGFVRGYLLGSSLTGKGMVVSVWESKIAADEYERSGVFASAIGPVRHLFTTPPTIDEFDVEVEA
jgi:heme-degrading monooxygenase HmoA